MSLLRDVLKRGRKASGDQNLPLSSKKSIKKYASSVKSSGGASMRSIAESISSFYSTITGSGPRVPKRRRPDYSRLGVPEWYADEPPPLQPMPGTAPLSEIPAFSIAHSTLMHATDVGVKPWLGLVLYSHAPAINPMPMYHNGDKIAGELRMTLDKPQSLNSIDVWFTIQLESVVDMQNQPTLSMTANLWNRKKGDPRTTNAGGEYKGKFPEGTFVFPFQFASLPLDTIVKHPDDDRRKNKGRVPLPPTYFLSAVGSFSGNIKYTVGVNIKREGLTAVDEEFDANIQYLPIVQRLPRSKTHFPFLPTREDWPFAREVVGGWTLTPFGGRGRLGEEVVELEGILGIQEPAVYAAGDTLEFSLMLWSNNPLALEALAQPGAIDVGFLKTDPFSLDALNPKNSSRKNRRIESLAKGRIWLTETGRPADDEPIPQCTLVKLPEPSGVPKSPTSPATTSRAKAPSSRMQQVWVADSDDADDATLASDSVDPKTQENIDPPPSPTPSLEGLDDVPDPERVVRLDGEIRVPAASHPSFRFTSMAREYVLQLLIKHPQYSHISPTGPGIVAEVPVWYVVNRFSQFSAQSGGEVDYSTLPIKGDAIPVGDGAVRLPLREGYVTTEKRPTFRVQRVAAF
ncbi:hypothetical protein R3P38DRAFT_2828582 [Favolaschia claudopus]|uniref:Arrestin-like N-terminal domain-containing protein n=1 Tax=Favolaschia claudopus TaxID=2862362 RepID=A0AAW0ECJ4_9AGAR